jgi:hypothetical protein
LLFACVAKVESVLGFFFQTAQQQSLFAAVELFSLGTVAGRNALSSSLGKRVCNLASPVLAQILRYKH